MYIVYCICPVMQKGNEWKKDARMVVNEGKGKAKAKEGGR
jgi:hypothetical protein